MHFVVGDDCREWVFAVLDDFDKHGFDFNERCHEQYVRETGARALPIRFADLSAQGWAAATWPDSTGIRIDNGYRTNKDGFKKVLGHELGHVAEFFWLTPRRIKGMLNAYREVYPNVLWHDVAHPWVAGFQVAYSSHKEATDDKYPPVAPIPSRIRSVR